MGNQYDDEPIDEEVDGEEGSLPEYPADGEEYYPEDTDEDEEQESVDEAGEDEERDSEPEVEGDRIVFEYEGVNDPIELNVDEIPELFEKAVYGMKMETHVKDLEEYINTNKQAIQVGHVVAKSDLLQQAAIWKLNNYSDRMIAQALYKHYMGNIEEQELDDQVGSPDLEKILDAKLAPITQKLQQTETDLMRERTNSYNDNVIGGVLADNGVGKLTEAEKSAFINTWRELYPGFNSDTTKINPRQVAVALKESGILEGRKPATQKQVDVKPGKNVPTKPKLIKGTPTKIAPGSTKTQPKKTANTNKSNTREAMQQRAFARGIF